MDAIHNSCKSLSLAASRDQNGRRRASKWDTPSPAAGSATEAAREAARKLNAKLAAEGKLTINATPPLLPPKPNSTIASSSGPTSTSSLVTEEVEINDSPRRLLLCQGNVQYEINKLSGAAISMKGHYIDPSEKGKMIGQRPLYILIQADSRDKVNLAVQRIQGIMHGDDPFVVPPALAHSGQGSTLPSGMYYVQEKVFVGLDNAVPEFNLRERIVGPNESYFNHITKETGAKVHLRGRGSGFIEPTSGREAFEALYVYISHTNYAGLGAAKKLVENLIQTVHTAYQTFQMQQSPNSYYQNYGGYPGQNAGAPPHRPPHMYNTPPMSSYRPPPHSGGPPPSYPTYPYAPPNRPPPQYNQHAQRGPNHNIPPNVQMPPPHTMYPNPASRHEGPRPLMSEQRPPRGDPQPLMQQPTSPYIPKYPTQPHPEPPLQNYDAPSVFDQSNSKSTDNELGSRKAEEKPIEPLKPARRRFTEAPAKRTTPVVQESVSIDKRSVSSLDQQSTQSHTPGGDAEKRSNMVPPVLPAPKLKPSDGNIKKESISSSGGFKMPVMPVSSVLAGSKKKLPAPPSKSAEKRRKLDEADSAEKKTAGFALLGSYDDSSDED